MRSLILFGATHILLAAALAIDPNVNLLHVHEHIQYNRHVMDTIPEHEYLNPPSNCDTLTTSYTNLYLVPTQSSQLTASPVVMAPIAGFTSVYEFDDEDPTDDGDAPLSLNAPDQPYSTVIACGPTTTLKVTSQVTCACPTTTLPPPPPPCTPTLCVETITSQPDNIYLSATADPAPTANADDEEDETSDCEEEEEEEEEDDEEDTCDAPQETQAVVRPTKHDNCNAPPIRDTCQPPIRDTCKHTVHDRRRPIRDTCQPPIRDTCDAPVDDCTCDPTPVDCDDTPVDDSCDTPVACPDDPPVDDTCDPTPDPCECAAPTIVRDTCAPTVVRDTCGRAVVRDTRPAVVRDSCGRAVVRGTRPAVVRDTCGQAVVRNTRPAVVRDTCGQAVVRDNCGQAVVRDACPAVVRDTCDTLVRPRQPLRRDRSPLIRDGCGCDTDPAPVPDCEPTPDPTPDCGCTPDPVPDCGCTPAPPIRAVGGCCQHEHQYGDDAVNWVINSKDHVRGRLSRARGCVGRHLSHFAPMHVHDRASQVLHDRRPCNSLDHVKLHDASGHLTRQQRRAMSREELRKYNANYHATKNIYRHSYQNSGYTPVVRQSVSRDECGCASSLDNNAIVRPRVPPRRARTIRDPTSSCGCGSNLVVSHDTCAPVVRDPCTPVVRDPCGCNPPVKSVCDCNPPAPVVRAKGCCGGVVRRDPIVIRDPCPEVKEVGGGCSDIEHPYGDDTMHFMLDTKDHARNFLGRAAGRTMHALSHFSPCHIHDRVDQFIHDERPERSDEHLSLHNLGNAC